LDYNRLTVAGAEKAKKDAVMSTGHLKADIAFLREKLAAMEEVGSYTRPLVGLTCVLFVGCVECVGSKQVWWRGQMGMARGAVWSRSFRQ
jgi:hypothetical protein